MDLNPRPSKIVFARCLRRALARSEPYASVLDCACAFGKNRHLFAGKEYHGVDINPARLAAARERHGPDPRSFFYEDDLLDFRSPVRERDFDLVVSTHTLHHITPEQRRRAVANLAARVKVGGSLIIQCATGDRDVCETVRAQFSDLEVQAYRGPMSRAFERWLAGIFRVKSLGSVAVGDRGDQYRRVKPLVLGLSAIVALFDGVGRGGFLLLRLGNKVPPDASSDGERSEVCAGSIA